MSTLVAEYVGKTCVGRCDARCYNAKGKECDCICGGVNHGVGLRQAQKNCVKALEATKMRGGVRAAQPLLPGLPG